VGVGLGAFVVVQAADPILAEDFDTKPK